MIKAVQLSSSTTHLPCVSSLGVQDPGFPSTSAEYAVIRRIGPWFMELW